MLTYIPRFRVESVLHSGRWKNIRLPSSGLISNSDWRNSAYPKLWHFSTRLHVFMTSKTIISGDESYVEQCHNSPHINLHSYTVHLDIIEVLLPTDAQNKRFKNLHAKCSNMFRCDHHYQGVHYMILLKQVIKIHRYCICIHTAYAATPPD